MCAKFQAKGSTLIFSLIALNFTFSYDKNIRATSNQYKYSFLSLLPNLPWYPCNHTLKKLYTSFQVKSTIRLFGLKFAQKVDLGLEFQRTNVKTRINLAERAKTPLRRLQDILRPNQMPSQRLE